MLGNLFIRTKDHPDFETFSKRIFALINIKIKEMRYSDNSPSGRYYYGEVLGLRVTLEEADDSDFVDYEFLLSFRPRVGELVADRHCLDGFADIVAKYLAQQGLTIARPLEFGKTGTPRQEYNVE